ncbi:hypothetical protein C8Q80DRAFT_1220098 [Daedaleopsis nitida]|nr:hypothetical protein C8Q80DRAFT_1220098 [Daedaleopsis nitida]
MTTRRGHQAVAAVGWLLPGKNSVARTREARAMARRRAALWFPPTFIPVANLYHSHIAGRLYSSFFTLHFSSFHPFKELTVTFATQIPSIARSRSSTTPVMNAKLALAPRNAMDAHAPAARPSLSVRCPSSPPEKAAITELAMTIAEEIASLTRSPQPFGIDIPLKHSDLDPKSLSKLSDWLRSAHDYDAGFGKLLEDDTTAEVLAADILASPRTRQSKPLPKPPKQVGSGSFASSRRARLAPRAPISVDVTSEPEQIPITSAAAKQCAAEIGMVPFDSWAGKKTSLVYGLLALGLVGSPMSPSVARMAIKSPAVQSPYNAGVRLRPIAPLDDPRAVLPTRTPIFASFLDSVRMPGYDLVQSPWVPDRQYASLDGMFADLSFPQTPTSI